MSVECTSELFYDDMLAKELDKLDGRDTISQKELISFLWKELVSNYTKAKKSGKKSVRFDPVFIKFAIYLYSKVNNST